jgi:hypothetical protein
MTLLTASLLTLASVCRTHYHTVDPGQDNLTGDEPLATPDQTLELIFAVEQRNLDALEEALNAVSLHSRDHRRRGQYLSYDEAHALTANREGSAAVVAWLRESEDVRLVHVHPHGHYIKAQATVAAWARNLCTRFVVVADGSIRAAASVSVPAGLAVAGISGLSGPIGPDTTSIQQPTSTRSASEFVRSSENAGGSSCDRSGDPPTFDGFITPALLREHFHIDGAAGSAITSQGVWEQIDKDGLTPDGGLVSMVDLATFQQEFGVPPTPVTQVVRRRDGGTIRVTAPAGAGTIGSSDRWPSIWDGVPLANGKCAGGYPLPLCEALNPGSDACSCQACLNVSGASEGDVGYCTETNRCVAGNGAGPVPASALDSNIPVSGCSAGSWLFGAANLTHCPSQVCSCSMCKQHDSQSGWCKSDFTCRVGTASGPSDGSVCTAADWVWEAAACEDDTASLTRGWSCFECAVQHFGTRGWCAGSGECLEGGSSGPSEGSCTDGWLFPSLVRGGASSTDSLLDQCLIRGTPLDPGFCVARPDCCLEWADLSLPSGPSGFASCGEASLDVQYLTAIAPNTPTIYLQDSLEASVGGLVFALASNVTGMPKVVSVSYGVAERAVGEVWMRYFNMEAMRLGTQGVTLVYASMDDGANSRYSGCGYTPRFGATSPYVTTVGGTGGLECGGPEVVANPATNPLYGTSSGGGFSDFIPRPEWQAAAVEAYFAEAEAAGVEPYPGFNKHGRAYPDVSMPADAYLTVVGGKFAVQDGTSAAAPVFAGLVTLLNAERAAQGLPTVGWLNPLLYRNASSYANDVTVGNNSCFRSDVCCAQGFVATAGWDPASGWGSVDYVRLREMIRSSAAAAHIQPEDYPCDFCCIGSFCLGVPALVGIILGALCAPLVVWRRWRRCRKSCAARQMRLTGLAEEAEARRDAGLDVRTVAVVGTGDNGL